MSKAAKVSTKPPSGTRDFLPADLARRQYVIDIVREVYRQYGFSQLETPCIENLSTLLGKYGEEGDQLLYRLLHRRDKFQRAVEKAHDEGRTANQAEMAEQGLRYDLTVPLARLVAQYGDLPKFFKRFQIQPVWRADRPGKGRFREFYQCDVDITGTVSLIAEAEVCGAVCSVLSKLGFGEFDMKLNHRELLRAMIRTCGIEDSQESTALVAVDKLDKIGRDGVANELEERGISRESALQLLELVCDVPDGSNEERLNFLTEKVNDEAGRAAIEQLRELCTLVKGTSAESALKVDPSLARGLSYYTGPIFEISVPDLAGSLGGGGRYDGLVGMFGKREVPAMGFSIGLERILTVMEERGMFPDLRPGPDVLLCWMGITPSALLGVATAMRQQGINVETYPEEAKLKKQLTYANAPGVNARFVVIIGSDELEAGEVTIKNLESGDQSRIKVEDIHTVVKAG